MADEKVYITLILDDKEVTGVLKGLPDKFGDAGDKSGKSFGSKFKSKIKDSFSNLNRSLGNSLTNMLKLQAAAIAFGSAFFLRSAVKQASELERSMRGLNSIAANFNVNSASLSSTIQDLAADGMIPLSEITESFKNLLRSTNGDLAVATKAFIALRDSAVNNRESQFTLGEAITQTSRGIRNQNSILSDASGVSKNLSQVNKAYAASIDRSLSSLSDQEKQLGSVIGLTKEAAISTGDYARSLNDFDGVISKIGGEFTRFQQNIGRFVTQSPVLLKIFKDIGTSFGELNRELLAFVNQGGIKQVTLSMLSFAKNFTENVLKPISYLSDVIEIVVKTSALLIQGLLLAFVGLANGVGKVFKALGFESELTKSLQGLTDATQLTTAEMKADLAETFDTAFDTDQLDKLITFTDVYRDEVGKIVEAGKLVSANDDITKKLEEPFIRVAKTAKGSMAAINTAIKGTLVKSATAGIQALTKTLLLGEKGFSNFGATIAGILGSMATQLGQTLLLTGIGMKGLLDLSGGSAIIAGAGLIALGTILSSFSGGGDSSASGSLPNSGANPVATEDNSDEEIAEREEQTPGINITIRGDVLDSNESGMRIVDIINKAYDQEGVVINRGAIA